MKLATKRTHLPKTQEKTQQWEKPKIHKSVEEAAEKAHPPRRSLTITNCKHHRREPYSRVIVPGPYGPDCGADGEMCGGVGRGSPQVLKGGEVNGGRTPEWASRVGWVLAVTEPHDEDRVRGGRCVPNHVGVRGSEDRNEITTFRRCRIYRTVI